MFLVVCYDGSAANEQIGIYIEVWLQKAFSNIPYPGRILLFFERRIVLVWPQWQL
jgi:hypothetical protein